MPTIPTHPPTSVDDLRTLCLYKDSFGTDCVTTPSNALLGQYCTEGSSTVCCCRNGEKRQVRKEDRLVGQGFIIKPKTFWRTELDGGITCWKSCTGSRLKHHGAGLWWTRQNVKAKQPAGRTHLWEFLKESWTKQCFTFIVERVKSLDPI